MELLERKDLLSLKVKINKQWKLDYLKNGWIWENKAKLNVQRL